MNDVSGGAMGRDLRSAARRAFTLVELLVVIAIIGVLVALLLPAVQAAREAARRSQCANQLRQIALGWQLHHDAHEFFPSGGWGYAWIGDPDRGSGKSQPGSWAYSILPHLEAGALYQKGKGATGAAKRAALTELAQSPVGTFYCPSRRPPSAYTNGDVGLGDGINYNFGNPPTLARSDYAANLGPRAAPGFGDPPNISSQWGKGPTLADGDQGKGFLTDSFDAFKYIQGVAYQRSEINLKHITDGATNTYMVGEKNVNPDFYTGGRNSNEKDIGDDQGAWIADDLDNQRLTGPVTYTYARPAPDQPGLPWVYGFGSAHPAAFHMAMCDASVRGISYDVDPTVHNNLGTRAGDDVANGQF
jgi:prepilin-type N-terminal cleavage/methylation domain-containing protein